MGSARAPFAVAVVQTTADLSQALTRLHDTRLALGRAPRGMPVIAVDDDQRYQRFIGVGGGLTDSSAWLIGDELSAPARAKLLDDLFGRSGIHLSFLRVPMGASDYTATGVPYTYDDLAPGLSDPSLTRMSIAHDLAYIVPTLRAALALNPRLYIEANPWTAPAWMKANDALDNADHDGTLLPSAYRPFARYFVRFIKAYRTHGIPIAAVTPQNEPAVALQTPGMELPPADESRFISDDLAPALRAAGLRPSIYGWDESWGPLTRRTPLIATTAGSLAGIAWHCYFGSPNAMTGLHLSAPGLLQIVDECSTATSPVWPTSELLIASLRNWANAAAMWNLALDPQGGPVQPPNLVGCPGCTGLVTVDEQTHAVSFSRDYYELGQLSRYVDPGAVRIGSNTFVRYDLSPSYQTVISSGLDDVAFLDPDGTRVLIAYNHSSSPIEFAVTWDGRALTHTLPAGATVTLTWTARR